MVVDTSITATAYVGIVPAIGSITGNCFYTATRLRFLNNALSIFLIDESTTRFTITEFYSSPDVATEYETCRGYYRHKEPTNINFCQIANGLGIQCP